ncbi:MAG: hypothetical protein ACLRSW_15155 [Christensenellaceae bacterium]
MNVRMMLMAIFVLILSFAVSSAISGALTKPISEMTEKARCCRGDFSVDFTADRTAVKCRSLRKR